MTMEAQIQDLIDKFHRKVEKDESLREKIYPVDKTANIDLGEEHYSLHVHEAKVTDFKPELLEKADITLITTPETMEALLNGTLRPMRAFVMKKIKVKGKIDDIMFLKELF
ncbi:MAG: SCP2 sterol-binding domain-containing protein [Candidatus Methanomethylophilaceae archaeon]|nr:SCP2 sterol-binding domain-containing protein [Candidatus Methanomethylophilaceae archaeon]